MQHHDVGRISGTSRKSVHPLDEQVKFATKSHGVKAMVVKNRTMLQIWGEASSPAKQKTKNVAVALQLFKDV